MLAEHERGFRFIYVNEDKMPDREPRIEIV